MTFDLGSRFHLRDFYATSIYIRGPADLKQDVAGSLSHWMWIFHFLLTVSWSATGGSSRGKERGNQRSQCGDVGGFPEEPQRPHRLHRHVPGTHIQRTGRSGVPAHDLRTRNPPQCCHLVSLLYTSLNAIPLFIASKNLCVKGCFSGF